jgi:hypothetical protein
MGVKMTDEQRIKLATLRQREADIRLAMDAEFNTRDAAPADSIAHVEAHARAALLYKQLLVVVRDIASVMGI